MPEERLYIQAECYVVNLMPLRVSEKSTGQQLGMSLCVITGEGHILGAVLWSALRQQASSVSKGQEIFSECTDGACQNEWVWWHVTLIPVSGR